MLGTGSDLLNPEVQGTLFEFKTMSAVQHQHFELDRVPWTSGLKKILPLCCECCVCCTYRPCWDTASPLFGLTAWVID